VAITTPRPARTARERPHVDGVIEAEAFRMTAVRARRGPVLRTTTITGLAPASTMHHMVDVDGRRFMPPANGAAITRGLGRVLGVAPGDTLVVQLIERGGEPRSIPIVGWFDPMMGQGLYMTRRAVNALLREDDAASGAYLSIAPGRESDVVASLREFPDVIGATSRAATIRNINEQMRESMVFVLTLIITSACVIAIGVVYNSARIALSERGRELASLRVLGFTTNEVAGMLFGEQAVIILFAIPLGVAFGALFSFALVKGFETERFHFPFVLALRSQLFAASIVTASAVLASLIVRRRVRGLDMVAALRTRE
jgi:putative ABC transport system permease protein